MNRQESLKGARVLNALPAVAISSIQIVRHISSCTDPGKKVALFLAIAPM
jgi:hypothetical protein